MAVHLDAGHFHVFQNMNQRAFQFFIDRGHLFLMQLRFQLLPQAQGDIGIFGGIFHRILNRHPVKGDGGFARAQQRFDRDRRVVQIAFGERVHSVTMDPRMQRVGDQHGVIDRPHLNPVA
jgi:hypothetical protein